MTAALDWSHRYCLLVAEDREDAACAAKRAGLRAKDWTIWRSETGHHVRYVRAATDILSCRNGTIVLVTPRWRHHQHASEIEAVAKERGCPIVGIDDLALAPPLATGRSTEEEDMRQAVFAWGRARWPTARIMEELDVGGCRIDIAFVCPDHIVGVEIKSSRDTLDRLPRQLRDYLLELPEVWVAYHPKWNNALDEKLFRRNPGNDLFWERLWRVGRVTVENGVISADVPLGESGSKTQYPAAVDLTLTSASLNLLRKTELVLAAREHKVRIKSRDGVRDVVNKLARGLTGEQIIAAVCKHLRARPRNWRGDAPMVEESA